MSWFFLQSNLILSTLVPLLSWTWNICIFRDSLVLKFFLQYLHLGIIFPTSNYQDMVIHLSSPFFSSDNNTPYTILSLWLYCYTQMRYSISLYWIGVSFFLLFPFTTISPTITWVSHCFVIF